jgi:Right handed beta helix region
MRHHRLTLFAVFTSAILLISLLSPQNASAQDETPPPTEVPVATDQPVVTEEALATDEATATQEPAATVESVATDVPAPAQEQQASVAEILDQIPDGTDVVVLGADGAPEPLASQAAADIIVSGDPMWCPAGVLPGGTGCTASYGSFTALIAELATFTESGPGTIYIDVNYSATGANPDVNSDIIFDYGAVGLTDLTFQGGWDFGSNAIVGTSNLTGINSLQFWDWGAFGYPGSLTLRDINLSGGNGLYVGDDSGTTTADVALQNVSVSGTNNGTFIGTDGGVSISDGEFTNNDSYGLDVESGADVTISDVDSFENASAGVIVASAGNVTLTSLNSGYNGDIGVGVFSAGNVTVENVWAGINDSIGLGVVNSGNVTLANSAFFDNFDPGAAIQSFGAVSVSNSFFGNCFLGSSMCASQPMGLVLQALGPADISDSQFSQNTIIGLLMAAGGDIVLNNVTATQNYVGALVSTLGSVQVCGGSYSDNIRFGFTSQAGSIFVSEQTLLTGNGDAPVDLGPGAVLLTYDCAPKKVKKVEIDCEVGQTGVELFLPNRDSMIVPCPMRGPASLSSVDISQLPGDLPDGFSFVSGLYAQAARDDLTVSFFMPLPDASYTVLYWNDVSWVELKGVATEDGKFVVGPVHPGIYVLATK